MFVVDSLLRFGGKTWYNAVRSSALMSVSEVRAISIHSFFFVRIYFIRISRLKFAKF